MIRLLFLIVALVGLFTGDLSAAATHTARSLPAFDGFDYLWLGLGVFGATLSTGALTLADWAKRLDPNGKVPQIVELLAQTNELLDDMRWIEGNLPTGHRTTVRTGLPSVFWRLLNQGVAPSKSTTAQIDEQAGMLEAWSEVDKDLALLNGNIGGFRLSESKAFLEAMNQEMAQTLIYGNAGLAPEEFSGLAVRYSDSTAGNGDNIVKASATAAGADQTSMWLVAWSEETVHGIFPKGSKAGLIHEDFGEVTVEVTAGVAGNRMRALQERYQWKAGLVVKDWRYVVRICNIDTSELETATPPDLIDAMEKAEEILPNSLGTRVFYCNRRVRRHLRKQIRSDVSTGGGLTYDNYNGKPALMFGTTPIRRVDAILNTEAVVT